MYDSRSVVLSNREPVVLESQGSGWRRGWSYLKGIESFGTPHAIHPKTTLREERLVSSYLVPRNLTYSEEFNIQCSSNLPVVLKHHVLCGSQAFQVRALMIGCE